MKRTAWVRETRMQRFEKALDAWTEKQLTQAAPPRLLGVCARTFRLTWTATRRRACIPHIPHPDSTPRFWRPKRRACIVPPAFAGLPTGRCGGATRKTKSRRLSQARGAISDRR